MRRIVTIALSLSLLLGLTAAGQLLAQDEKKDTAKTETPKAEKQDTGKTEAAPSKEAAKDETKKDESKKDEAKKDESKKEETKAAGAAAKTEEEPLPTIPPDVEAKLEAARKAVAEAIVAAQDAGLVQTSIDPPPVLDILVTGRATDERQLRKALDNKDLQVGVSPEVFGAWFTGYGKMQGITAEKNVRITQPSKGLKTFYEQRADMLNRHIEAVRKAKGGTPKAETPKAETPKAEPPKTEAPKGEAGKAETPKTKEEPKTAAPKEEPKKDQPK